MIAEKLVSKGFISVIFNFRGTGATEGDIGMRAWCEDLRAVIDFAAALPGGDGRIALLGFSAGGSAAIRVAADDPRVSAVVSASSPREYSFLQRTMPLAGWIKLFREIGLISSEGFPPSIEEWEREFEEISPMNWVDKIAPRPLLVMHGEQDELVPLEHARDIFEKAGEPKEFHVVPRGKHRLRVDPVAVDAAVDWLARWKG